MNEGGLEEMLTAYSTAGQLEEVDIVLEPNRRIEDEICIHKSGIENRGIEAYDSTRRKPTRKTSCERNCGILML